MTARQEGISNESRSRSGVKKETRCPASGDPYAGPICPECRSSVHEGKASGTISPHSLPAWYIARRAAKLKIAVDGNDISADVSGISDFHD